VTVSSSSLPFPKSTRVSFAAGFGVINWYRTLGKVGLVYMERLM
jgi:hypothetical protein